MDPAGVMKIRSQDEQCMKAGIGVDYRETTAPFPLHWHDYLEVEMITEGSGEQILNGHRQTLRRGSISVLRLTDYHQITPMNRFKLIHLALDETILDTETLAALSTAVSLLYFTFDEDTFQTLEQICILCCQETAKQIPDRRYLKNLISCFFLKLFAAARLGGGHQGLIGRVGDGSPDADQLAVKVDVLPLQCQQLSPPHSGGEREGAFKLIRSSCIR